MATWFTLPEGNSAALERLEAAWADAPTDRAEVCEMLLDIAREQVIAYAPTPVNPADTTTAPLTRYVYAQLQQARNLWNAGRTDGSGDVGGEFTYTPRPLDKSIRTLIRPVNGKPRVY